MIMSESEHQENKNEHTNTHDSTRYRAKITKISVFALQEKYSWKKNLPYLSCLHVLHVRKAVGWGC